jgi:hypothetical protein
LSGITDDSAAIVAGVAKLKFPGGMKEVVKAFGVEVWICGAQQNVRVCVGM